MSILNVNQLQPVGGGNTITVGSSNIDYSGSITGNISVDGNLTVTGVVSNEDVTNIDSVGVITARNGLQVTGGNVGINSTVPGEKLDVLGTIRASQGTSQYMNMYPVAGAGYFDVSNSTSYPSIIFRQIGSGGTQERLRITSGGSVGIGTDNPSDKLSIYAPPNSLVFGAKDTTRGNHIFQLLADDSAGNGELRLYQNSGSGTHTKTVEIASSGNSYFTGGNVGINETSPQYQLHVHDDTSYHGIFVNGNGAPRITFARSTTTTGEWSVGIDGTNGNNFAINNSADNSNNKIIISSSQISLYGNTYVGGNVIIPSGNGIDFSATANSSGTMSSELLDDYEEGTFTPVWGDGSSAYSSPAPTYSTQAGYYTKIGNVVHYDIHIVTTAWNSAGTVMWIYGLPFTTRSSPYQHGGGGTFCIEGVDSQDAINNLTTQIAPNKTNIEFYYQTPATGANYNTFGTNNVSEGDQVNIRVSGFYYTNS